MFYIDSDQLKEIDFHFSGLENRFKDAQKEFVRETSDYAFIALRNNIPKKTGKTKARIKEDKIQTVGDTVKGKVHIPPNFQDDSRVPQWLHHGTGVWGPVGRPYHPIHGEFMTFKHNGRLFRLKEVRGQRRNPYWDETVKNVDAFATIKAHTLFSAALTKR